MSFYIYFISVNNLNRSFLYTMKISFSNRYTFVALYKALYYVLPKFLNFALIANTLSLLCKYPDISHLASSLWRDQLYHI